MPDQALIEIARRTPRDRHALEQIRGLPPQTFHRRGDALLEAIVRGRKRTPPAPPPEPPPRDSSDAPVVSLAQALVRHRSSESGVAVELIATQAELAALMAALRRGENGAGLRVARGWRRELVGDELRELAAGRRSLSVAEGGRLEVTLKGLSGDSAGSSAPPSARSSSAATISTSRSWPLSAITWTASGSPFSSRPAGTLAAGSPRALAYVQSVSLPPGRGGSPSIDDDPLRGERRAHGNGRAERDRVAARTTRRPRPLSGQACGRPPRTGRRPGAETAQLLDHLAPVA